MRFLLLIALFTLSYCSLGSCDKQDDDFAEFDDEEFISVTTDYSHSSNSAKLNVRGSNEREHRAVQDDEDEDDGIEIEEEFDEEEFEGKNLQLNNHKEPGNNMTIFLLGHKETASSPMYNQRTGEPELTVAKVPLHFG